MKDVTLLNDWKKLEYKAKSMKMYVWPGDDYVLLMCKKNTICSFATVAECNAFLEGMRRGPEITEWIKKGAK